MGTLEEENLKTEVRCLCLSPNGVDVAAGYADGSVRLWQAFGSERLCKAVFQGHKREVSCVCYSKDGSLVASGSADTEIVIWDADNETGLYRLLGHKDRVTCVKFLFGERLVSSSKDSLLKVWDLQTQHCVETLVGHRNEIWCFDIDEKESRIVCGSSDDKLRVWKIPEDEKSNVRNKPFFIFVVFFCFLFVVLFFFCSNSCDLFISKKKKEF